MFFPNLNRSGLFGLPSLTVGLLRLIANHFGQANSNVERALLKGFCGGTGEEVSTFAALCFLAQS